LTWKYTIVEIDDIVWTINKHSVARIATQYNRTA